MIGTVDPVPGWCHNHRWLLLLTRWRATAASPSSSTAEPVNPRTRGGLLQSRFHESTAERGIADRWGWRAWGEGLRTWTRCLLMLLLLLLPLVSRGLKHSQTNKVLLDQVSNTRASVWKRLLFDLPVTSWSLNDVSLFAMCQKSTATTFLFYDGPKKKSLVATVKSGPAPLPEVKDPGVRPLTQPTVLGSWVTSNYEDTSGTWRSGRWSSQYRAKWPLELCHRRVFSTVSIAKPPQWIRYAGWEFLMISLHGAGIAIHFAARTSVACVER